MTQNDFVTKPEPAALASEISCLKALVTLMLKSIGQADAGKVILKMEKQIAELDDAREAAVYNETIAQIKQAFRR
ncbi:DUF2594 family protein [Pantoea sp. 1.19]|uniref:DUF2594 family protein n=1 Tax=Pantoea sp. 1.19 TaxID=1925589 RepID=UPI000948CE0A|nr:DUF2594 family protein [Pantoea sp. 1.19]